VDGERVNSALAPVDWRSERGRSQFADLARLWEAAQFRLAEDEPIIERDFKPALTARAQRHIDHDRRPGPKDLSRQTDGLLQVVSGHAVFDRDAVLGIKHQSSVSAVATDPTEVRILEPGRQLEPVAEQSVDADVAKPDQRHIQGE